MFIRCVVKNIFAYIMLSVPIYSGFRNIVLPSEVFCHRNSFTKELNSRFRGAFTVKGLISVDVLAYFFMHLKDTMVEPLKNFEQVKYTDYVGPDYWLLNDEVNIR